MTVALFLKLFQSPHKNRWRKQLGQKNWRLSTKTPVNLYAWWPMAFGICVGGQTAKTCVTSAASGGDVEGGGGVSWPEDKLHQQRPKQSRTVYEAWRGLCHSNLWVVKWVWKGSSWTYNIPSPFQYKALHWREPTGIETKLHREAEGQRRKGKNVQLKEGKNRRQSLESMRPLFFTTL